MNLFDFDDMKPVIISAVIILNIAFNSLVIAVIVRYPQLREDLTTLFMFSLSLSDLANGCTVMPISAAVCSKATTNVRNVLQYLPHIQAMCSSWFVVNSMHSLCWVTVCKMVAITKPLHYEQTLTQARCYIIIAGIWLFGAIIHNTTVILWKEHDLPGSFKCCAIWALYSNTFVNSLLYLVLFRQVRSKVMDMLKTCYKYCDFRYSVNK